MGAICDRCGLPIDICSCKEIEKEQKRIFNRLNSTNKTLKVSFLFCNFCGTAFEKINRRNGLRRSSCPKCGSMNIEEMGRRFHEVKEVYFNPSER